MKALLKSMATELQKLVYGASQDRLVELLEELLHRPGEDGERINWFREKLKDKFFGGNDLSFAVIRSALNLELYMILAQLESLQGFEEFSPCEVLTEQGWVSGRLSPEYVGERRLVYFDDIQPYPKASSWYGAAAGGFLPDEIRPKD